MIDNITSPQTFPLSVVVQGGGLDGAELSEQLLDVKVRHPEIQVGDDQLARACCREASTVTTTSSS